MIHGNLYMIGEHNDAILYKNEIQESTQIKLVHDSIYGAIDYIHNYSTIFRIV